jgi:predicted Ser/Thr protein kinase
MVHNHASSKGVTTYYKKTHKSDEFIKTENLSVKKENIHENKPDTFDRSKYEFVKDFDAGIQEKSVKLFKHSETKNLVVEKENMHENKPYTFYRSKYKFVKEFDAGIHAKSVKLFKHSETKNLIVKKKYNKKHINTFNNEVKYLRLLDECSFVSKLLYVDESNLCLFTKYCGKTITSMKKYKNKITKLKKELKHKWGIYHNDIRAGNVCIKDDKLFLIDFGWASHKKLKAGYKKGQGGYKSHLSVVN